MTWSETDRLAALDRFEVMDTPPEPAFDQAARLASHICETRASLINIVGDKRSWAKARFGVDERAGALDVSICQHAIRQSDLLVINDARADERCVALPEVVGPHQLRFYAGAPLRDGAGFPLGTLCVFDSDPRTEGLSEPQAFGLRTLADQVMAQFEMKRLGRERELEQQDIRLRLAHGAAALAESERRFKTIAESMPHIVWSTRADGSYDYFNSRWYEFTGSAPGDPATVHRRAVIHPDDRPMARERWRHALASGQPYEAEYRLLRADGVYRWTLARALPVHDEIGRIEQWLGALTDIDEIKQAIQVKELLSHELSHRIKNIFAVVGSLIALSARRQPEAKPFADDLRARVSALAKAHEFIRPHARSTRPLITRSTVMSLLGELLRPYEQDAMRRLALDGEDCGFDDGAATPLALVFHELATNAATHGAWSSGGGRVTITGRRAGDDYGLEWCEQDGPPIADQPRRDGFGYALAVASVEVQLRGRVERSWNPEGLTVRLTLPLASLNRRTSAVD